MLVASDEATAGSVMAKQDRISPDNSRVNHSSYTNTCTQTVASIPEIFVELSIEKRNTQEKVSDAQNVAKCYIFAQFEHIHTCVYTCITLCTFCCSVPYLTSTSMLPVSGALQLNSCGREKETDDWRSKNVMAYTSSHSSITRTLTL